jgi:predicted SAM-dependent methyltransferase
VKRASVLQTIGYLRREDSLRGVGWSAFARTMSGTVTSRRQLEGARRLHLGCGENLLPGWANVDLIGFDGVIPWNLARPLPVDSGTVDLIYSEHFIEHITLAQAGAWLADCHRVLRPGGVIRISTPDLRTLIAAYQRKSIDDWADVDWRPASPCKLVNEGMRLWGHEFIFDLEEITAQLTAVGFSRVERRGWHDSPHAELRGLECRPDHGDLIIEATK